MGTKATTSKSRGKVGERLKEFRKSMKMNQKQIADVLQVEQALISMVENSKAELAYWHVKKLKEIYKINPEWLEDGLGEMFLHSTGNVVADHEPVYTPKLTKKRTERIMEVVDALVAREGMANYEDFCERNGLYANYLYEFQGNRIKDPNKLVYDTLYKRYGVNLGYVFYDDNDMFAPGNDEEMRVLSIVVDRQNNEVIKAVPVYAQAGYQRGFADPEFIEGLPDYDFYNDDEGTYRVFELKGDSMFPHLQEGDFVKAKFLPPVHWRDKLRINEVFVVVTKDGVVCKQLADHDPATGNIKLHSFNSLYADYTLNLSEVYELWYYKGFYSRRTLREVR